MGPDAHAPHEQTALLQRTHDEEALSILSKEELDMANSTVGERLPYNDYTTIDWLHDLVKDSYRHRSLNSGTGLRNALYAKFEASSGWIAVMLIGALTACVAFVVDVSVATVSDWKLGYCSRNPLLTREACCERVPKIPKPSSSPWLFPTPARGGEMGVFAHQQCEDFKEWSSSFGASFAIYVALALLYGVISSAVTLLTKRSLPAAATPETISKTAGLTDSSSAAESAKGKTMYMSSGSGIPEIKTVLSGFNIPHFLSLHVLVTKAIGATFAVSSGLNLGKEGPFVHISTCVGHIVGHWFPKYAHNGRKLRELLAAACSAGLAAAFGAPIGGVLFSYEEISTYFPRKVLWRAFLCSLSAAMLLKQLNPTGSGKLVLFETNYGTSYQPIHYIVFIVLGIAGGVFGGIFCRANFVWSKWFRALPLIKKYPTFEVAIVVVVTGLLQFPSPLTRDAGDIIIKNLLVDCRTGESKSSWICVREMKALETGETDWSYIGVLMYATLIKLVLTIITFGIKVPSGVIIPALSAGAFFGRLLGQSITSISPGIFAMVGSAAFLAGVSRMTISLGVIMFELTGELEFVIPHMIAILVAKWTADAIGEEGVYDIAQSVLGHPFLDAEHATKVVKGRGMTVGVLVPPKRTMREIEVVVGAGGCAGRELLESKIQRLQGRGLMDAGLVITRRDHLGKRALMGYVSQSELEFGLERLGATDGSSALSSSSHESLSSPTKPAKIRLLPPSPDFDARELASEHVVDLQPFVDRTPLTLVHSAPLEYAVEMFSKLGLRYLCVVEEGSAALVGVVIKKRLVGFLERLKEGEWDESEEAEGGGEGE